MIFWEGEMIEELSGGEAITTSNRMEITAAIMGLRAVPEPSLITLEFIPIRSLVAKA